MDDRDRIIARFAEPECKRIARKVVRTLQSMTEGMQSGEDSGLANLWDEVCVQVQDQQSVMWELYVEMMEQIITVQVNTLSVELTKAIWLQTDNGSDWDFDEEGSAEIEYFEGDIVDYILSEYVLKSASDWTNRRIEKYLEGGFDF